MELIFLPPLTDRISPPIFYSSRSNFSYSLIVDLQDFLKRDPTLSSLSDNTNLAVDVTIGDSSAGNNFDFVTMTSPNSGIDIPKNFGTIMVPNNRYIIYIFTIKNILFA